MHRAAAVPRRARAVAPIPRQPIMAPLVLVMGPSPFPATTTAAQVDTIVFAGVCVESGLFCFVVTFVPQSMEVGPLGKLGAPAVQHAAEEHKNACAAVRIQHRRTMGRTARGLRTSLRAVTTEAAQVSEGD